MRTVSNRIRSQNLRQILYFIYRTFYGKIEDSKMSNYYEKIGAAVFKDSRLDDNNFVLPCTDD